MKLEKATESELALLSAVLLMPGDLDEVRGLVSPEDFAQKAYGAIFAAMCRLGDAGKPVDKATVIAELVRVGAAGVSRDELDRADLGIYVNSASYYATAVAEASLRRRAILTLHSALKDLASGAGDAGEILDAHATAMLELAQRRAADFRDMRDCMRDSYKALEQRYSGGAMVGLPSGFSALDELTCGFRPGDLVIVAGRPSMGKTAFALNLCANVAIRLKKGVAMFEMEMPDMQLADRSLCSEARIDSRDFRAASLRESDWSKLAHAAGLLADTTFKIDATPELSLVQIRTRLRRLAAQLKTQGTPLALVVIDYLQLMEHGEGKGLNRDQAIGRTSRGLKTLAKQLGVPIVALSQLNRDLEKRPDKRPMMSDLRESGNLEQDADTIIFLYRDEVYYPLEGNDLDPKRDGDEIARRERVKGTAEVIIGKQRNGPPGAAVVAYDGPTMTFRNLSRATAPHWSDRGEAA